MDDEAIAILRAKTAKRKFDILLALQIIGVFFIFSKISIYVWLTMVGIFLLLYVGGLTYGTINKTDDVDVTVTKFWYRARSIIFLLDIVIVIGLYAYIFFHY